MIKAPLQKTLLFFIILSGLALSSCARRPKILLDQVLAGPQHHLDAGEYREAIVAYDDAFRKYPAMEGLLPDYIDSLEKIMQMADRAYQTKKYSEAEKIYLLLLDSFPLFEDFRMALSFSSETLNERIKDCRLEAGRIQARRALQAGGFSRALASMKSVVELYPADPESRASLAQIGLDIHRRAADAMTGEDYITAGKAFFALQQNIELLEKLGPAPPFTRLSLEEGINACRVHLIKKGLEQYRKGNLAEAIGIWEGLLAFDPTNVEIQKAVQTATEQLKKIKKEATL